MTCLIWNTPAYENQVDGDVLEFNSPRAGGVYRITGSAIPGLANLSDHERARLTTWLVDQRRAGNAFPTITTSQLSEARTARSLSVAQRKERFFRALLELQLGLSAKIKIAGNVDENYSYWRNLLGSWTESISSNTKDVVGLIGLLIQDGLLERVSEYVELTSKGWSYLDGLGHSGADTLQVFVAMWFSEQTQELYDIGIAPAIRDAGYVPFRIDAKEHNNKIDDEIILEIRRSRFLVADFTAPTFEFDGALTQSPRGGVYYEAGFARGLAMEVISMVRADQIGLVHFDTRQISHVLWTNPAEARERLYHRIGATIGEAPGAPGKGKG